MAKTFRRIEATFQEPAQLENATLLGRLELKHNTLFAALSAGSSNIALATAPDGSCTYELDFLVVEDERETETVQLDVVLVKDLLNFRFDGPALHFADLRNTGNCGGHVFFFSRRGDEFKHIPTLGTASVREYLKPTD